MSGDRFDEVLGPGRGRREDEHVDDSPLAVARELVDYINAADTPWEQTTSDGIVQLIPQRGLVLAEQLSLERRENEYVWDFNGFLLVLATVEGARGFAAIRLHNSTKKDRTPYAELWRLDSP